MNVTIIETSAIDDELQKLLGDEYESIVSEAENIRPSKHNSTAKNILKKIFLPAVLQWSKLKSLHTSRINRLKLKKLITSAEDYAFKIWRKQQSNLAFEEVRTADLMLLRAELKYDKNCIDITPWMQFYFCKSGGSKLSQIKDYIEEFCKKYKITHTGPPLLELEYMNPAASFKTRKMLIDFEAGRDIITGYEWYFDEFKFM